MWINIYISDKTKALFSDGEIYTSYEEAKANIHKIFNYIKTCKINYEQRYF